MTGSLTIGDFSRVTFLSVKTLRHYHRAGLLEPAEIDPITGYRRYAIGQIPVAQVIRRFRDLDMPLDEIGRVLQAPDQTTRSRLIAAHLTRLEETLADTQRAVAYLRDLLEHPSSSPVIEHRRVPPTSAAAITSTVGIADLEVWYQGAIGEIQGTLSAQGVVVSGPPGGIYANELFADERGDATLFLPVTGEFRPVGRVRPMSVPAAELAVITHSGSHDDLDRSYGALATYVSEHALAVDGLIRECYLIGPHDTDDESAWRTEIGWPIFETRPQPTTTEHTHDDVTSSAAHHQETSTPRRSPPPSPGFSPTGNRC
jgi:DNA-binding transcriptional MerR regulator